MRNTKLEKYQLAMKMLELLLKHKSLFGSGLCSFLRELAIAKIITCEEKWDMIKLIKTNKPARAQIGDWWWECGLYSPRFKFLVKLVNKYQPKEKKRR
jgi:hypothetical protein